MPGALHWDPQAVRWAWKEAPRVLSLKEPTGGKKATESDPGGMNLRLQVCHQPTSLSLPREGGKQ